MGVSVMLAAVIAVRMGLAMIMVVIMPVIMLMVAVIVRGALAVHRRLRRESLDVSRRASPFNRRGAAPRRAA
jgi:hypothetical protein